MVFTTAGGGANQLDTGYNIDNSMRFNRGDSPSLTKTFSGSPTSTKICTISFWTKLADPADTNAKSIFSAIKSGSSEDVIKFMGVNNGILNSIEINFNNTSDGAMMISSGASTLIKFRDPSAWYHFVIAIDSSQGTASNRVKAYVNGTQFDVEARVEGGSVTTDIPLSQNYELGFLTASAHDIGKNVDGSGENYDGYLSEFYFIDGQQLAPTEFAETNDNGVWIPKTYEGTYGNYGFFLEFQDSGNLGDDTSGNTNDFTATNLTATDQTTDTPTNNFATLNSVAPVGSYAEGNLRYTTSTTDGEWSTSTISISTNAKWYCEVKAISKTAGAGIYYQVGVTKGNAADFTYRALYRSDGAIYVGGSNTATFSSYTDNDIISIAYDSSNRNVTFYKNGNSEGTVTAPSLPSTSDDYFFGASSLSGGNTFITEWNFGNAPFTISSGNSDANGYGNFEYAVPSGYYALCTKNLAEYG